MVAGRVEASVVRGPGHGGLLRPSTARLAARWARVGGSEDTRRIPYDLPGDLAARLMQTAVRVARAVQQVAEPGGISLWSSNGAAADQEVPHVHLHVLARYADDGLLRVYRDRPERPQRASLDELAAKVRAALLDGLPTDGSG